MKAFILARHPKTWWLNIIMIMVVMIMIYDLRWSWWLSLLRATVSSWRWLIYSVLHLMSQKVSHDEGITMMLVFMMSMSQKVCYMMVGVVMKIVNYGINNISVDDGIHDSWRLDSMEIFVLIKMINWSNLFRGDSFHHRVFPCHEGKKHKTIKKFFGFTFQFHLVY